MREDKLLSLRGGSWSYIKQYNFYCSNNSWNFPENKENITGCRIILRDKNEKE